MNILFRLSPNPFVPNLANVPVNNYPREIDSDQKYEREIQKNTNKIK